MAKEIDVNKVSRDGDTHDPEDDKGLDSRGSKTLRQVEKEEGDT